MLTVLLAEDDPDDQELLTAVFAEADPSIRLLTFSTGNKILHYLHTLSDNQIPDMIVLDYNLPEQNGAELLRHLAKNKRYDSVVKIVWSTSNATVFQELCLSLGAQAYLVKPSDVSSLNAMARKILSHLYTSSNPSY